MKHSSKTVPIIDGEDDHGIHTKPFVVDILRSQNTLKLFGKAGIVSIVFALCIAVSGYIFTVFITVRGDVGYIFCLFCCFLSLLFLGRSITSLFRCAEDMLVEYGSKREKQDISEDPKKCFSKVMHPNAGHTFAIIQLKNAPYTAPYTVLLTCFIA